MSDAVIQQAETGAGNCGNQAEQRQDQAGLDQAEIEFVDNQRQRGTRSISLARRSAASLAVDSVFADGVGKVLAFEQTRYQYARDQAPEGRTNVEQCQVGNGDQERD